MKGQKGQDIVEFALLFPVFMIIITGIIYVGFLFGDYVSLNNQARSVARDAAVVGHYTTKTVDGQTSTVDNYAALEKEYSNMIQNNGIVTGLYSFKNLDIKEITEEDVKKDPNVGPVGSVRVILTMTLNKDAGFGKIVSLLGIPKMLGEEIPIKYYMHDETYQKSGS